MSLVEIVHRMPPPRRLERLRAQPMGMAMGMGVSETDIGAATMGFNPVSLSPSLWIDARVFSSAGAIASWPDISGNGRNFAQSTPADQPSYAASGGPNGLGCVTATGTQWLAYSGTFAAKRNWTMFAVIKLATTAATVRAVSLGSSQGFQGTNTNKRELVLPGVADLTDTTSASTTSWEFWEAQDNGTTQSFWVNGTLHTLSGSGTPVTPNASNGIFGDFGGTNLFNGSLQAVLRYETTLTTQQRQNVEAYFRAYTALW